MKTERNLVVGSARFFCALGQMTYFRLPILGNFKNTMPKPLKFNIEKNV